MAYDSAEILGCIQRLMTNEFAFNKFFGGRDLQPTALWYEDLVDASSEEVVKLFAETLQLPAKEYQKVHFKTLKSQHTKIGDSQSESMISQFKAEHPEYVKYWEQHRGEHSIEQFRQDIPNYGS